MVNPTPARKSKRGLYFSLAFMLLILLFTPLYLRKKARDRLNERCENSLEAIRLAEPWIRCDRRFPFEEQRPGEASRFYRCIDRLALPEDWPASFPTMDLPSHQAWIWAEDETGLAHGGSVVEILLDESGSCRNDLSDQDIRNAMTFAEANGQALSKLLQRGAQSTYVHWPARLEAGSTMGFYNESAQQSAAALTLFLASRAGPSEAVELALLVYCHGWDCSCHPSALGFIHGQKIQFLALESLSRRLRFEGLDCSQRDLRRIISAFEAMPEPPFRVLQWSKLEFDATLVAIIQNDNLEDKGLILGQKSTSDMPETILWRWSLLDQCRQKLDGVLSLPLTEACVLQNEINQSMERNPMGSMRTWGLPNAYSLRRLSLSLKAKAAMIQLGAAAKLYRLEHGAWPHKIHELDIYFKNSAPKDPFTEGADFSFDIDKNEDLGIRAATPPVDKNSPASVALILTLRNQREQQILAPTSLSTEPQATKESDPADARASPRPR